MSEINLKVALTYLRGMVAELPEEEQRKYYQAYNDVTQAIQSIIAVHGSDVVFIACTVKFTEMQIQNDKETSK